MPNPSRRPLTPEQRHDRHLHTLCRQAWGLTLLALLIALLAVSSGCAQAGARVPAPGEALEQPKLPSPEPEKPQTAAQPTTQHGYFILGDKIPPPQGCIALRNRGGSC